jgi:hypothetical protein
MLFASRYAELAVTVQSDATEWVRPSGPNGALQPREIQPMIQVEFKQNVGVPLAARLGALAYFGGKGALAHMIFPNREDGILGSQAYEGFEPERAFGFYETERAPAEHRPLIEAKLLSLAKGNDVWLYEPERIKAPWPSYDQITTKAGFSRQNRADKIAQKVREDGYNPVEVIAYERENVNDELTVRALEALMAEDIAKRAEAEALRVEV